RRDRNPQGGGYSPLAFPPGPAAILFASPAAVSGGCDGDCGRADAARGRRRVSPAPMSGGKMRSGNESEPVGSGRQDHQGSSRWIALSDAEWARVAQVVAQVSAKSDSERAQARRFVDAALSVMIGNCVWSRLPAERFGDWRVAYNRNERWIERGVWTVLANSGVMTEAWSLRIARCVEHRVREKRFRAKRGRRGSVAGSVRATDLEEGPADVGAGR
ncbi:transposase, partial [Pseudomonas sp. CGJS7]|uniref:transposase n=1 Tax=Pseudomonas sp. CGJS7 TaxID=3109348 RepID=UPI0030096DC0